MHILYVHVCTVQVRCIGSGFPFFSSSMTNLASVLCTRISCTHGQSRIEPHPLCHLLPPLPLPLPPLPAPRMTLPRLRQPEGEVEGQGVLSVRGGEGGVRVGVWWSEKGGEGREGGECEGMVEREQRGGEGRGGEGVRGCGREREWEGQKNGE